MLIFIQELLLVLILSILKMMQGLLNILHYVFGISNVTYNNHSANIIELLIDDQNINYYLYCIILVAILVGGVFSIISIIKTIILNKKSISNILGKYIITLITLFITLFIIVLLVKISNSFFKLIIEIFSFGYNIDISNTIFDLSVLRWNHHYNINDINILETNYKDIYGTYLFESYQAFPLKWNNDGYINPDRFMYLPCLITSCIILTSLLYCCYQLIRRIYEMVLLYIVMPISIFTISFDDGIRFKIWLELFIKKLFMSFSVFISINIYIFVFSIIKSIKLYNLSLYENNLFFLLFIAGGSLLLPSTNKLFSLVLKDNNSINYQMIKNFRRV